MQLRSQPGPSVARPPPTRNQTVPLSYKHSRRNRLHRTAPQAIASMRALLLLLPAALAQPQFLERGCSARADTAAACADSGAGVCELHGQLATAPGHRQFVALGALAGACGSGAGAVLFDVAVSGQHAALPVVAGASARVAPADEAAGTQCGEAAWPAAEAVAALRASLGEVSAGLARRGSEALAATGERVGAATARLPGYEAVARAQRLRSSLALAGARAALGADADAADAGCDAGGPPARPPAPGARCTDVATGVQYAVTHTGAAAATEALALAVAGLPGGEGELLRARTPWLAYRLRARCAAAAAAARPAAAGVALGDWAARVASVSGVDAARIRRAERGSRATLAGEGCAFSFSDWQCWARTRAFAAAGVLWVALAWVMATGALWLDRPHRLAAQLAVAAAATVLLAAAVELWLDGGAAPPAQDAGRVVYAAAVAYAAGLLLLSVATIFWQLASDGAAFQLAELQRENVERRRAQVSAMLAHQQKQAPRRQSAAAQQACANLLRAEERRLLGLAPPRRVSALAGVASGVAALSAAACCGCAQAWLLPRCWPRLGGQTGRALACLGLALAAVWWRAEIADHRIETSAGALAAIALLHATLLAAQWALLALLAAPQRLAGKAPPPPRERLAATAASGALVLAVLLRLAEVHWLHAVAAAAAALPLPAPPRPAAG
jgi:hypothetical protein